jgi:hypothetical protein
MRADKKAKPLAVCSVCQALTERREQLGHRCGNVVNGRRCYGTYQSALTRLWDACEGCESTGKVGTQTCGECKGFGWRLYS